MEKTSREKLIRIAITGPESTGKSLLCKKLAAYYKTLYVPEYAREYLNKLERKYTIADILKIAKKQIENEGIMASNANKILFCDTELLVSKVWSEFKYKKCDKWILDNIIIHKYDLFLLCDIDLPWEPDPLREHPDKRRTLFDIYTKELNNYGFPFEIISGTGNNRLLNAINYIEKRFDYLFM